jgi:competence protein ComEA
MKMISIAALVVLLLAGGAQWLSPRAAAAGPRTLAASPADVERPRKKAVTGKLNLNTATIDELMLLPGIGPAKAERVVAWRSKHGPFRRVADLRKVKGFGYKTLRKLLPNLDVKGESTLRESG